MLFYYRSDIVMVGYLSLDLIILKKFFPFICKRAPSTTDRLQREPLYPTVPKSLRDWILQTDYQELSINLIFVTFLFLERDIRLLGAVTYFSHSNTLLIFSRT